MSKILSQAEIDALLTNVSSSGGSSGPDDGTGDKKVTLYDFKHPNLVSKEQLRLLETIHEGLLRNFSVFLSAQLRMIVDMNLLGVDQVMYSEFMMSITTPGAIYMGALEEPYSQFILEMDPRLAIFIVERLFGGSGTYESVIRPISQIEQRIMKRIVDRFAKEIQVNWKDLKKLTCEFNRFESNPEFVQIVPASEPVVVVTIEINVHGNSSMMNICYPYMWISNIMSSPEIQEKILFGSHRASDDEQLTMIGNLHKTAVDVRALLGDANMTVQDFMNLKVGDVIRTKTRIDQDVRVFAMNRELYQASVGTTNQQFSILINSITEGEKENANG